MSAPVQRNVLISICLVMTLGSQPVWGRNQSDQGSVYSTNQIGGITARDIGVVVQAPERDAQFEQLSNEMVAWNRKFSTMTKGPDSEITYANYLDSADPGFSLRPDMGKIYIIIAEDQSLSDDELGVVKCRGSSISLVVFYFESKVRPEKKSVKVTVKLGAPEGDRVVSGVCAGLTSKIAMDGDGTYFDYISHGKGVAQLTLVAPPRIGVNDKSLEPAEYWSAAFYQSGIGSDQSMAGLFSGTSIAGLMDKVVEGKTATMDVPMPDVESAPKEFPYPSSVANLYGDRLVEMHIRWLAFIARATVTIDSIKRPLSGLNGRGNTVAYLSAKDVTSGAFVRRVSDMKDYLIQLNCIAARFAVGAGYARASELPDYDRCPLSMISVR